MLAAHDHGDSLCGDVCIEMRTRGTDSSIYTFSVDGKPVAQANIRDYSVEKLKNLPEDFSSVKYHVMKLDSGKLDVSGECRIGDLRPGLKNVCLEAVVSKKSIVRAVTSGNGAPLLVCSVTLSDGTGEIPLTLRNNQIETVFEGDRVQIHNATVSRYRGEPRLLPSRKAGGLIVIEPNTKARLRESPKETLV
jgi:ssDNA-binding replication factor A large subunit